MQLPKCRRYFCGDVFNPYNSVQPNSNTVSVDDKDVVINIDTDKVKGISDAVGKFATGVDKISEQKINTIHQLLLKAE